MKVVGKRVYLEPIKELESESGFVLELETSLRSAKTNRGTAVYVGDVEGVVEGDIVLFDPVPAKEVTINGKKLLQLHESALYGVFEK
jgi:co-chaperonin GroES (HSP10)